jgi:D-alanine-D-alanine ligase
VSGTTGAADRRTRVLLLFGGRSAEHDVSRVSAVAVARALDPERYEVIPVAIGRDGRWVLAHEARALLADATQALPGGLPTDGEAVPPLPERLDPSGPPDIVVPLLHGPYGEDGTVQCLLEIAGLAYVGSGVVGSAVGMDKVMMKRAFVACGLPTPRFIACREWDLEGAARAAVLVRVEDELGYPCFVKPANMGSSVGVSRAADRPELEAALDRALAYDEHVLVEEAIVGREIEVGVLGDRAPEASVPGEIVPGDAFYTYADKYLDGRAALLAPAPLTAEQTAEVRGLAVAAFEACHLDAMARVDFFLADDGRGFLVNEVNTIPGFTEISMFPRLWELSGVPYPRLIERLIELGLARHARRDRRAGRPHD